MSASIKNGGENAVVHDCESIEHDGFGSFSKILEKHRAVQISTPSSQIRVYLWTEKGAFPCQMISE